MGSPKSTRFKHRATKDRQRFTDSLEIIKFLCKDFWALVFGKQVDHLKTNHRGIYVLTDSFFRWTRRMASDTADHKKYHLAFPCGLIRGALAQLGVQATVTVEYTGNTCIFQLSMK